MKLTPQTLILVGITLLCSSLFILVVSHELVHYARIDSASGICLGKCGDGFGAVLHEEDFTERENTIEELWAYSISAIVTFMYLFLVYLSIRRIK